jgi:predicted small lipoprotein YifL
MKVLSEAMIVRDRMNMMVRQFRNFTAAIALLATAGCGIKGPLYLPPAAPSAAPAPASPPASPPSSPPSSAAQPGASGTDAAAAGSGTTQSSPAPAEKKP